MNQRSPQLISRSFLAGAGFVLCTPACLKFLSVFGKSPCLDLNNPIFNFLTNRVLMLAVALLETAVVVILLGRASLIRKLYFVAWLAGMFFLFGNEASRGSTRYIL